MEETINQFHEAHAVEYIMLVKVDGEVKIKYTDEQSFDGVASYSTLADEAMQRLIIDDANGRAEYLAEAEAENQMEQQKEQQ